MKPLRYLFVALALAFALPAATGLLDSWSWLMFGETRSWIEWDEGRVALAWAFLFPALGCAMAARGLRNAADGREG